MTIMQFRLPGAHQRINLFHKRINPFRFINLLGLLFFSAFLVSGALKPEGTLISKLPFNITIATMALSLIFCTIWFLSHTSSFKPIPVLLVLLLFATFAPGIVNAPSIPAASTKMLEVFTGTLTASICLTILLDRQEFILRYLKITHFIALVGILNFLTGGITTLLLLQGGGEVDRVAMFGVNPIEFGRLAGALFLVSCLFIINKTKIKIITPYWYFMAGLGLLAGMLSGSRGPVFAAIIVMAFYLMLNLKLKRINLKIILISVCIILGFVFTVYRLIPESSYERIVGTILSGKTDDSMNLRAISYDKSLYIILRHPSGIGWAGFVTWVNLFDGMPYQYPHNILVEIFLEGGWIPGFVFVSLMGYSFIKIVKNRQNYLYGLLACLYFYYLINAMVSSDIVGNRTVFALLFLIIGVPLKKAPTFMEKEEAC